METTELVKPSLTGAIREQIRLNQERGDRKSRDGHGWGAYGKDISHYEGSFFDALNYVYIESLLKDKPFPVVIDLMGPSTAIASLFEHLPDKPKFGLAVSLEDLRNDEEKKRDKKLGIKQVVGDIMKSSTWKEIEEKLQGHKADLIMERALGGLACIPSNPRLYAILLNKAWGLLSANNGILIAEFYNNLISESEAKRMISIFKKNKIDASIGHESPLFSGPYSDIKIVKTPKSPEKLPFLK